MNFKKNVLLFTLFFMASSAQAELARSNNNQQTESQVRECSNYNVFIHEPVGTECVVLDDDKNQTEKGRFKRTTITYTNGEINYGIEIVGTGIILEDVRLSEACQTDTITFDDGSKIKLDECFRGRYGPTMGAEQYCKSKGLRLPTKEEFITLEQRGFRKVTKLSDDMESIFYWSSSFRPDNYEAYGFYADDGVVGYQDRNQSDGGGTARCVSDTSKN